MLIDQTLKPPVARKEPRITTMHGRTLIDDYAWLRDKSDPDVLSYLTAENHYAEAMMKPTEGFQDLLYKEMLGRIKETDENVPYRLGRHYYYSRTEEGKQYPIYCRKKNQLNAPEEIALDLNELAKGHNFMSLGAYEMSEDGRLLAFSVDTTGYRQYDLHIKDLNTGEVTGKLAGRVTSFVWANDNRTFFFVQEDEQTKRSFQLFRGTLDGDDEPELLFEEEDELYRIYAFKTRSRGYVMVVSASSTTSECRFASADSPRESFHVLLPRKEMHEYYADHLGELFYITTNDQGRNFRLVTAPVDKPGSEHWKEIIAHRNDVMLEGVDCFKDFFVVHERFHGVPAIRVFDPSGAFHTIEMPEPVYMVFPVQNMEFETTKLRFRYESLVSPWSVYDYDMKTRHRELLKQQPVLGGYDPDRYQSERSYAKASDGTAIPISIVYKKNLKQDGPRPFLLDAYGSYGYPYDVHFSSSRLSLLDRGVIFGIAHVRGGGDLGKGWHDNGKLMAKKNTFTDFIACAEHLIKEKYTSSHGLIITGGSAGGLLTGAVTNMRPDLFKAVVAYVPFVDVINTMLDASLPLTVGEYLEWGNPHEKPAFDYMISYSPYDNIDSKAYPAMLVKTSLNDSQVMFWEPAKYVAKLRALKTDTNPLLFKTKLEPGGHGGSSGRYDRLKDTAFDYAFILDQFGIAK